MKLPVKPLTIVLAGIIAIAAPITIQHLSWLESFESHPSISRRASLQNGAIFAIIENPIMGVGINRFSLVVERWTIIPSTTRFLQPIHNVPLLLVAETGLVGLIFILLIIYFVHRLYSLDFQAGWPVFLLLAVIFSLDHYLLTIHTGNLLLILTLFFYGKIRTK